MLTFASLWRQCRLEDDFLNWQARMWPAICEKFGLTYREGGDSDTLYVRRLPSCARVYICVAVVREVCTAQFTG